MSYTDNEMDKLDRAAERRARDEWNRQFPVLDTRKTAGLLDVAAKKAEPRRFCGQPLTGF